MYIVSTVCTCKCTFMEIDFDTYNNLEFSIYSCRAVALSGAGASLCYVCTICT